VESRVDLRDCLDEPSRAHLPCAMLDGVALERVGSLTQETVAEPQAISSENLRRYLSSDEDTHWISTAAARAEGSERRTGKFHPALRGVRCEFPSSKSSEHPVVASSGRAAPGVEIRTLSNRPRPSFRRHPAKDGVFPKARMFGSAPRS
jgi:hypothetical protein